MLTFGIWVVIQPSSHDANQVVKNLGTWYRHYHLTITNNHHHQQPPSPTTTININQLGYFYCCAIPNQILVFPHTFFYNLIFFYLSSFLYLFSLHC
jgi:hypothetical protein